MKTCCFYSKHLYNPFTQQLGPEVQFESSDKESDTKDDRKKNTNIKESGNYGNGQVDEPDVKLLIFLGMIHCKVVCPRVKMRMLQKNDLIC